MQRNTRDQNKGFTIHVDDTYVGFLTIGEKNVPAATVKALQEADNMKAVLAKADLRPYQEKPDVDTKGVMDIIGEANKPAEAAQG